MAKRKGRDWSEWKEHITGMHRLDSGYKQSHLGSRYHRLQTQTAISLRDLDLESSPEKESRVWVWILVFLGLLLVRKCYFEFTKYDRIKSQQTFSREK